jgi:hypothetical protein
MARPAEYSLELRERAVRMVQEHAHDHPSPWCQAIGTIDPPPGTSGSVRLEENLATKASMVASRMRCRCGEGLSTCLSRRTKRRSIAGKFVGGGRSPVPRESRRAWSCRTGAGRDLGCHSSRRLKFAMRAETRVHDRP